MYKIFDLHNDYFLKIQKDSKKDTYLSKNDTAQSIISAVWTSELNEKESFLIIDTLSEIVTLLMFVQ